MGKTNPPKIYSMIIAYDQETGRYLPSNQMQLVNKLLDLKRTKSMWEVIDFLIDAWIKREPKKWKSYLVEIKGIRETRKISSVGGKSFRGVSRDDRENGAITSYLLDIPAWIVMAIRKLYDAQELPMDKKFYYKFARKFPAFLVRERV